MSDAAAVARPKVTAQREAFPFSGAEREQARLVAVLATIALAVSWVLLFSFVVTGSDGRTAVAICLINNAILLAYAWRARDALMPRLLLYGLIVGGVELVADAWLVDATHTLDYSISHSLMLWRSPWWMPLAWELVAVQFGYIGLRLYEKWGTGGLLLSGLLGAINVPFYEEMALRLGWWRYTECRKLLNTPYYIIVGEFLLIPCFGLLARSVRQPGLRKLILSGIASGLGVFVAYVVGWYAVNALAH